MYAYLALAALQLVGGFQQADIIRQNGTLQGKIADMNAQFAEVDSHNALVAGYSNAARYQTQVDQVVGADKAAYAGANVDVRYGTATQVQDDNRVAGFENVLQMQKNAQNQAIGYEGQAINIKLGGQMTELQSNLNAAATQSAGMFSAASTALTGYAYGQSTGKGTTSRTGTDSSPVWNKTAQIHTNDSGDGVRAPATSPESSSGMRFYPDPSKPGDNGQPGFFGHGPREDYNQTALGSYSFTSETGG